MASNTRAYVGQGIAPIIRYVQSTWRRLTGVHEVSQKHPKRAIKAHHSMQKHNRHGNHPHSTKKRSGHPMTHENPPSHEVREYREQVSQDREPPVSKKSKRKGKVIWKVEEQEKVQIEERAEEPKEEKVEEREQSNEDQQEQTITLTRKRRHGMGIVGIIKSINFIGMGHHRLLFIQNLAMMLNAGLPLIEALQTFVLEVRHRTMRKIVRKIIAAVEGGCPLWEAMDEQCLFSPYEIALVRVGEEAGNLARNMEYLSEQLEKDHALKQKVKMAMIYPTIVLVLMFIVVIGMGMFVLPNLVQVLYSLNVELPLPTRIVILFTEFFTTYGTIFVPSLIGGFLLFLFLAKFTPFKAVSQWMTFRIPGIGRLAKEASIARFGVILGGLLQAGVPVVESLQSLEEVTTIVSYKRLYRKLTERVALGDSFGTCFHDLPGSRRILPPSVQQLVSTGERSGSLACTFLKVARIYERKAEETAAKLPVILEPLLLLIIGGLVGGIALSIIMPIYTAVGNVANG